MFEIPDAKRVRREDLNSPTSSRASTPDADALELFRTRFASEFEFAPVETDNNDNTKHAVEGIDGNAEDEEEGLEFNLFAPTTRSTDSGTQAHAQAPQRIQLDSDDDGKPPGFIQASRHRSYYFADNVELDKTVVLSGNDVARLAKTSWPGCVLPWRVKRITISGRTIRALAKHNGDDGTNSVSNTTIVEHRPRTRKGKKARIAIRKKHQSVAKRKEDEEAEKARREEKHKEKKTRKNRGRKLKRKEKGKAEKAQKAAGAAGDGATNGDGDEDAASGGSDIEMVEED